MTGSPGASAASRPLPTGTVTFLRTDIEGSMAMAKALGDRWDQLNARHLVLIRDAVGVHGGLVVRTEGDAVFAVFPEAGAGVAAAVDAQRALSREPWPDDAPIRVRMGLHAGEAHLAGDDYGGLDVNRAARIAAVGHGGQVILSGPARELAADRLPPGVATRSLGDFVLKDVIRPESLHQLDIAGLPTTFPAPRAGRAVHGNLDERLTSFVGRERDVEAVTGLLDDARLVTLTGPGGIGKTSLAVEVARAVEDRYPDGAWLVPLATIDDPADVRALIARTIGLFDGPVRSAAETLDGFLQEHALLLVLDNFEHVIEAAPIVRSILRESPGSRVLVTSRAALHVGGEQEFAVGSLGSGDPGHDPARADAARQLFLDRARAVKPGWEPGPAIATIDAICDLVDGLPLGIELAAARIGSLSPAAIHDRLAARLPLPGPGVRDAPARQRTLESAVAWSHDLLEPARQTLLQALAVFEGGFDVEQVDAVADPPDGAGDRLDDLLELADRSLIVPMPSDDGRSRFRLLQTIQAFALGRLTEAGGVGAVRRRHAEAFLTLASEAADELGTSQHAAWLARTKPELSNFRAATRWTIEAGEAELALRLVGSLWRIWHANGLLTEARALTLDALAMPAGPTAGSSRAWAAAAAGSIAYWQSDSAEARRWYEEQVRLSSEAGDERCVADAYFNLGHVAFVQSEDEAAMAAHLEGVIGRFRDLGDERGVARASWGRGVMAVGSGRYDEAIASLTADLATFERLDDPQYHSMTAASLAWAAFASGDVPTAIRLSVDALLETYRMGDIGTTTISLHVSVLVASLIGRFEDAAALSGAFDALCERYGVRPPAALGRFIASLDPFEVARAALEPMVFETAYERGRRMSIDEAVELVVVLADAWTFDDLAIGADAGLRPAPPSGLHPPGHG